MNNNINDLEFNYLNDKLNGELTKYLSAFYKKHLFSQVSEADFINVFKLNAKKIKEEFDKIVFIGNSDFVA